MRLKCGDHVLSEADNWYVKARLTPDMNHMLETTDTPLEGGRGAPLPPPHAVGGAFVVAAAEGLGDGRDGA